MAKADATPSWQIPGGLVSDLLVHKLFQLCAQNSLQKTCSRFQTCYSTVTASRLRTRLSDISQQLQMSSSGTSGWIQKMSGVDATLQSTQTGKGCQWLQNVSSHGSYGVSEAGRQ